ncbi:hypothetical protein [Streptomyces catenulae]|uniref:PucR C-terminal helix-turn-helix domain-containing protein n=1 Tax=Streptomyces catenulae TaxID=66875 RepID=A0ABV2YZI2_9ACTN|nr:hypothetical protein [Streptomyces catenulae]
MHHLLGRLSTSDPEAGDSLRIVAYFDVLLARGSGVAGLLRGAAVLAGCTAGAEISGRIRRRDPEGKEPAEHRDAPRAPQRSGTDWAVWLERDGEGSALDEMIVDRLAFGVELLETHRAPTGFDAVVDDARPLAERVKRLPRFRLDPSTPVRILATAADAPELGAPSAVVPTRYGLLRATLDVSGRLAATGTTGIGPWARADQAPESWEGACIAFRLTDADDPVVDASDLGAVLMLLRAHDPRAPHDDVRALARLDARSAHVLRTLVEADSIRSAAATLGMHHSSVQARHEALVEALGYDPRTNVGKMRYIAAELLQRLTDTPPGR